MTSHRNLAVNADRLATAMKRLSSGLRVNSAADDAAGLGVAARMRAQISGLEQANRNIQDGISLLQTIEGALSEVHAILHRARDLAMMHATGTLDFNARAALYEEFAQLCGEVARIQQTTQFNGIDLLMDSTERVTLQVGAGSGDILSVTLADLWGTTVGDLVRVNSFQTLPMLPATMLMEDFDAHIDDVAAARSRFGSVINRLESALRTNQDTIESYMSAESRIMDADMAQEVSEMTKAAILQQSASMSLLFAQRTPKRLLNLLDPQPGAPPGMGMPSGLLFDSSA